jgi:hypothetical protein
MELALLILIVVVLCAIMLFAVAFLYVSVRILFCYAFNNKRPFVSINHGMVLEEHADGTGEFKEVRIEVPKSLAAWLQRNNIY